MKYPLISVIMPVYNTEQYLRFALDSLLRQTFTNFEVIAVNDASTDDSSRILREYAQQDARIHIVTHTKNKGIVATMNEAIGLSKGEYLARMDADDIAMPSRFAEQVAILQHHPKVVLVAGVFEIIDEVGEYLYREVLPADDRDIKRSMYIRNPMAHGSTMFRKSAFVAAGPYTDHFGPTEDYELWSRLAQHGEFRALETTLYRWRVNLQGIMRSNNEVVANLMDGHYDRFWAASPPPVRSAVDLRRAGRHYIHTYPKRGVAMKHTLLTDNARIALKMIARKRFIRGAHQLLAVALSSRTGLQVAFERVDIVARGLGRRQLEKHGLKAKPRITTPT